MIHFAENPELTKVSRVKLKTMMRGWRWMRKRRRRRGRSRKITR